MALMWVATHVIYGHKLKPSRPPAPQESYRHKFLRGSRMPIEIVGNSGLALLKRAKRLEQSSLERYKELLLHDGENKIWGLLLWAFPNAWTLNATAHQQDYLYKIKTPKMNVYDLAHILFLLNENGHLLPRLIATHWCRKTGLERPNRVFPRFLTQLIVGYAYNILIETTLKYNPKTEGPTICTIPLTINYPGNKAHPVGTIDLRGRLVFTEFMITYMYPLPGIRFKGRFSRVFSHTLHRQPQVYPDCLAQFLQEDTSHTEKEYLLTAVDDDSSFDESKT